MIRSIHRASTPQCKKDKAIHKAEVAKQECSEAAQHLIEAKLDSLLMIEAPDKLLPWQYHNIPKIVPIELPQVEKIVIVTVRTGIPVASPDDILLSTTPLPSKEDKESSTLLSFVPIEGDHIIKEPTPWRLVRKKPNGAIVLVHEDNFPINYSSNILYYKLLIAMLTTSLLTLEAMCLHLEDVITHIYVELYCSLRDITVHYAEVCRCMCTTIDPNNAIVHHIAQVAQDKAITAAQ